MTAEETIDNLVDKVIDDALKKSADEDIKKRKPKPFRYITDEKEIQTELEEEKATPVTVMEETPATKIVDDKLAILGLGDIETIENVIKRHEGSRKFREK